MRDRGEDYLLLPVPASAANDCFIGYPKVTYVYKPASDVLANGVGKVTAFYRLEYGASETGGRGLAKFAGDTPRFFSQDSEGRFNAVNQGTAGSFDNIHDLHAKEGLFVPGCRPTLFDCFHMHWRWNPKPADVPNLTQIDQTLIKVWQVHLTSYRFDRYRRSKVQVN